MTLATTAYFVLAALGFGFVIFIHELGHFLFAKWAGVKVEVFSIGFGPKIARKQIGETEYALSLLPFGGYVKMLGQDDNPAAGQADADEPVDPRSFLAATPKWKALILLGGVLFNLLSSYAILLGLAFSGMPVIRPLIGEVPQRLMSRSGESVPSPGDRLGLRTADRILKINGEEVRSFEDVATEVVINAREPVTMVIRRRGEDHDRVIDPDPPIKPVYSGDRGFAVIGLDPPAGDHIRLLLAGGASSPLELGDRIVGIGDDELPQGEPDQLIGQEIHQRLLPYLGRTIDLTVERRGQRLKQSIRYAGDALSPVTTGFPVVVMKVVEGSSAAEAGIVGGDVILEIDGHPAVDGDRCLSLIREAMDHDRPCHLKLYRPGEATSETHEYDVSGRPSEGGRRLIGIMPQQQLTGRMFVLPTLDDLSPSPLQTAGVHEGDTVISPRMPKPDAKKSAKAAKPESDQDAAPPLWVASGGERVLIPASDKALDEAAKVTPVPALARWIGVKERPSVLAQIYGTRVESGGLAPGFVRVTPVDGSPTRDVDVRLLEEKVPGFIAALKPGDWILGHAATREGLAIELLRGVDAAPKPITYDPGVAFAFDVEEVPYHLSSWREAFAMVNTTSYNMVVKSLQLIPRFFRSADQGGINPNKSLTGPVGMFRLLKAKAEQYGLASYLKFLALMGLNLFLVNLLPIPITDGGQLLMLGIETAVGRPLPLRVRNLLQWAGFILVVGLMLYVLGLDLSRFF